MLVHRLVSGYAKTFKFCLFCAYQESLLRQMSDTLGEHFDTNIDEYVDNNLLKVNVFYREFSYKEITETPAYEASMHITELETSVHMKVQ